MWLARYIARIQSDVDVEGVQTDPASRVELMNSTNPAFILRNYILQDAIEG